MAIFVSGSVKAFWIGKGRHQCTHIIITNFVTDHVPYLLLLELELIKVSYSTNIIVALLSNAKITCTMFLSQPLFLPALAILHMHLMILTKYHKATWTDSFINYHNQSCDCDHNNNIIRRSHVWLLNALKHQKDMTVGSRMHCSMATTIHSESHRCLASERNIIGKGLHIRTWTTFSLSDSGYIKSNTTPWAACAVSYDGVLSTWLWP